jgi:uncharacterized iron-regulated protein
VRRTAALLVPLLAGLVACAAIRVGEPPLAWQSAHGRDHPLAGSVWDVAARRFLDAETLVARLARDRFVLLGEKHDNPDHHRLQAWVLGALITAGRRPAVAFEMFTVDDAPKIARYLASGARSGAGLGDAVDWSRSGWPPWTLYQPIADRALAAGLPIVAANLGPATTRAVARQGLRALDPSLVARLHLDRALEPEARAEMAAEIREGHCGYAREEMLDGMIAVQRARDAQMADRLAAAGGDGAVLIAGAGHVRKDRGVPAFLAVLVPDARVGSVAFVEVSPDAPAPEAYAMPADYLWFTPRFDPVDPCERFREPLERLRERRGGADR